MKTLQRNTLKITFRVILKKNKNIENDNGLNEIYHNNGKGEIK